LLVSHELGSGGAGGALAVFAALMALIAGCAGGARPTGRVFLRGSLHVLGVPDAGASGVAAHVWFIMHSVC